MRKSATTFTIKSLLFAVASLIACYQTNVVANSTNLLPVNILYLEQLTEAPPALSNILPPPQDQGLQGAQLAIADSNTTGKFLKQSYELVYIANNNPDKLLEAAEQSIKTGNTFIVAHLSKEALLKLNKRTNNAAVIFNVSIKDNDLRNTLCTTGLLHTVPSRAMLTDSLAQFLATRRWNEWLIIQGQQPEDQQFVDSITRSAKRFGGSIVEHKQWTFDTDLRRTAQKELPAFTRAKDYHVTLVADEVGDFGEYLLYNTWHPRPIAGTQGLMPVAWHRVVEQWGAAQLQNRFIDHAGRWMNDIDYSAWLAVRSIAETVTRLKSVQVTQVYNYLLSEKFELAAFKGRKLSFRDWNGQLRQPIPLVHPRSLVSQSPQTGYLHPHNELDTLGYDKPEVNCNFNSSIK